MAGIYLHIPFCKQACHYCDFHFSTDQRYLDRMLICLKDELTQRQDYLENEAVETIYFGGGTPSLLGSEAIRQLLDEVYSNFQVHESPEITLEANPDDLTKKKLNALKAAGINRLSIGLQTFDPGLLTYLNRVHTTEQGIDCIRHAHDAGFENISADLIYAIPNESGGRLDKDLQLLSSMDIQHISTYCLTIEAGTVFGNWYRKGKLHPVDEDLAAIDYEKIMNHLRDKGFDHYEISNFSLPGFHSRHNTSYWEGKKYLGIGPGAHSYNQWDRHLNVSNNARYMKGVERSEVVFETDVLSKIDRINEFILVGLRTKWGLDLSGLKDLYGFDLENACENYLASLSANGLARIIENHLILTDKGKLLADQIAEDLFQLPANE